MNYTKLLFLFAASILILNSCSGFSEAGKILRNEKLRTTDEFLVKKKNPLIQPPDFEKIPEPGTTKNENAQSSLEKILNKKSSKSNRQIKSSSTENSILNQIKK